MYDVGGRCIYVYLTDLSADQCSLSAAPGQGCLQVHNHPYHWHIADAIVSNCILVAPSGTCLSAPHAGAAAIASRFNDLYAPGGSPGVSGTADLFIGPAFADPATGDFHVKSTAGRWDPSANSGAGGWVTDGTSSPCIDAGDPWSAVGAEPSPNGGRTNMGNYGGTQYASKTSSGRHVVVASPNGGETWTGIHEVDWRTWGNGWATGDTVTLEYWEGSAWQLLNAGSDDVPYNAGSREWNVNGPGITPGPNFKVRVTANADPTVSDESDAEFTIQVGWTYYVKDPSTINDVWCTAPGEDANDGLTPSTPKATVQSILSDYSLGPGDTVYVDTGTYVLPSDITVTNQDDGSEVGCVRFVASPRGAVLDRSSSSLNARCWYLNRCHYVTVEGFACTGATDGYGIESYSSAWCILDGNECYGNKHGIYVHGAGTDNTVQHCILHGNSRYGIYWVTAGLVRNNTCYGNGIAGLYAANTPDTYRNNILAADGTGKFCLEAPSVSPGHFDYNDYWTENGASVCNHGGRSRTLGGWQSTTGQDTHSLLDVPGFVDPGAGDFHLGADSKCVDAGDPFDPVGEEPLQNGGRINMGAYGGTPEATTSPTGRVLSLLSLTGGGVYGGTQEVRWLATGLGWSAGDTVAVKYSDNRGQDWHEISEALNLAYSAARFSWNTASVSSGTHYRIHVTCNQDGRVADESNADFTIRHEATVYYVNDDSTVNDVYCTTIGDDANDGAAPATPKASIHAILDAYDLEPGDTVYVDTGYYTLATDIVVGSQDSGSASAPLRFVGSTHPDGTTVDRNSASTIARCWYLNGCSYVTVGRFRCTGGTKGRGIYGSWRGVTSCTLDRNECYGNTYGMDIGSGVTVQHCILRGNSGYGIYSPGSFAYPLVRNNTCYDNGMGGVYATTGTYRNNILVADGSGKHCLKIGSAGSLNSDYNVFRTVNGASVFKQGGTSKTLSEWQIATGQDLHSVLVDPLFADAANGDFHLKSQTGRFVPGSGWVTDPESSPCIDVGHPADSVGDEPSPNGGRVNLGAYGGTAEASMSRTARALRLVAPNGGEQWAGARPIWWVPEGDGWDLNSDAVTIELSDDGGATWTYVLSPGVSLGAHEWWWDTTTVPNGTSYRVRVASGSYSDSSDADFTIDNAPAAGDSYYVNDVSLANDVYCAAAGDDANDGLAPATPKATIQAVLDAYDLGDDSTVFVDTGTYLLDTAIAQPRS